MTLKRLYNLLIQDIMVKKIRITLNSDQMKHGLCHDVFTRLMQEFIFATPP